MSSIALPTTTALLADLVPGRRTRDAVLVVGTAAIVGLAAQVAVPVPGSPVPVTGQTFVVLVGGAALGMPRAVLALSLYAVAGVVGVPWFADHATSWGSPTFGYVLGFLVAAALVGTAAHRGYDRSVTRTFLAMLVGTLAIYVLGVPILIVSTGLGLSAALANGVLPFLLGDLLKAACAAGLLPGLWRLVRR